MRSASITTRSRSFISLIPQLAAILIAAITPACAGDAGADGANGLPGGNGSDGPPGEDGTDGTEGPQGDPGESVFVDQSLSPLEKAFVGIGGEDLVAGLTSMEVTSAGARWLPGESFRPTDAAPKVSTFDASLSFDLAADSLRVDYTRDINLLGLMVQTNFSEIVAGDVGVVEGVEGIFGGPPSSDMVSERWGTTRRHQRLLHPHLILRDIAADPTLVLDDRGVALLDGSVHHLLVVSDPVSPVTLWVSAATGWIGKVALKENDPLHRDVDVEAFFYGWGTTGAGGLRFPSDAYIAHDGYIVHQEKRTEIAVNAPIAGDLFAFPAGASPSYDAEAAHRGHANNEAFQLWLGSGLPIYDGQQTFVQATELSPGVHYLTGGSHNSMMVDQANGLVLIEAPLEQGRSEAILAWAETVYPGKPVTHVVTTHHHSDHSAGVRTILAAGATSVISEVSVEYFKEIFAAPSQVYPDALELNPVDFGIEAVTMGGSHTIADPARPVVLHHIPTAHCADMLIVHVPSAQVVFNSDMLNPGNPIVLSFPQSAMELHSGIVGAGIAAPDLKLVGGHGAGPNTFAEFEAALGL